MKILLISLVYILGPVAIILLYNQFKFIRKVGTIMMAYAVGIVISRSGVMNFSMEEQAQMSVVQEWIMNLAVPIAIPLMLFSSDFKLFRKCLKKTFTAMIGGVISVLIAVFLAFFIFRGGVSNLWKVGGMMVGMYTGGTMNFVALGQILHTDPTVFTLLSTFDMVLSFLFLVFIIGGGYKLFRWALPFPDESMSVDVNGDPNIVFEKYKGMLQPKTFGKTMLGFLLSLLFLIIGGGLSLLITGGLNTLVVIFTITALAIAASFVNKIRNLPKTFELGMYFIIVFSIVIASQFNIDTLLNTKNLMLFGFIAFVIIASTLLHILFSRIFKVDGDLFTVAHVGSLYSPPFIPPVVSAMGNKKVLLSGIVIGLAGYAIGTYFGVGMAEILKSFGQ